MIDVLLVGQKNKLFLNLHRIINSMPDINLLHVDSGKVAIGVVEWNELDLIIASDHLEDMTGLAFIRQLVWINPSVSTSLVSDQTEEAFHETSEGLGILSQLPTRATKKDIEKTLMLLSEIKNLQAYAY